MRVGIDLGGTKISAIALSEAGDVIAHSRVDTPREDPEGTLIAIQGLIDRFNLPPDCPVGVGIPGSISPHTGQMRNANSTWLAGLPLKERLESTLKRPVRLANDADCLALSEAQDGAGAGHRTVFAANLGTGVGAGVVVNGALLYGPNGMAAEWGHIPMPLMPVGPVQSDLGPDAGACYCGKRDCVETYLSGPGLAARHWAETGEQATPRDIAKADTPARAQSMARYKARLGASLGVIVTLFDPDIIVLGGGMSDIQSLYPGLEGLAGEGAFCFDPVTPIVRNKHGADSGVRGAAQLWSLPDNAFGIVR